MSALTRTPRDGDPVKMTIHGIYRNGGIVVDGDGRSWVPNGPLDRTSPNVTIEVVDEATP